jgi:hypothetical protein
LSFIKKLLFIVLPSFVFSRPLVDFFIRDFAVIEVTLTQHISKLPTRLLLNALTLCDCDA